jgi:hypothetical protein
MAATKYFFNRRLHSENSSYAILGSNSGLSYVRNPNNPLRTMDFHGIFVVFPGWFNNREGTSLFLVGPLPKVVGSEPIFFGKILHLGLEGLEDPGKVLVKPLEIQGHFHPVGVDGVPQYLQSGEPARKVFKALFHDRKETSFQ